ncbi:MAG: 30S ribosomal protein S9 [Clostridium sp.]|nr:30S ribosomal protein S9 [Clostridium sp.]
MANAKFYGTGRRKKSIARVYIVPGTGNITINKRDIDEYFGLETLKVVVRQPLVATETSDKFDVLVNVRGGGFTGQAGAIRHGLSRALLQADAASVQQEIICCSNRIKMVQKPRKIKVFRGFTISKRADIV